MFLTECRMSQRCHSRFGWCEVHSLNHGMVRVVSIGEGYTVSGMVRVVSIGEGYTVSGMVRVVSIGEGTPLVGWLEW